MAPADDVAGLVVAGAGARGAYEAGALSVLAPRLAAAGASPTVLVGTSAGAVNVVGLAGWAAAGWPAATAELRTLWSGISLTQIAGVVGSLVRDEFRYLGQLLGLRTRLPSLLDTGRQRETFAALLPLTALHENVASGAIDAVAVTATSVDTGGTVVFVEKNSSVVLPGFDAGRNIRYVETELTVDHVLASAAVPVAFRPVRVTTPASAAGWYVDGGVRLNVPLKPALALGAGRLGVVATHPASWPVAAAAPPVPGPDVFAAASLTLQSMLADRMVEDLLTLGQVNALVGAAGSRAGYRRIPFVFAGPPPAEAHALGELAATVAVERFSGLRGLRHPDAWLLDRLVGGTPADHGELLSFLLFEPPFTRQASALGAQHAVATLGPATAAADWRTALG